MAYAEAIKYMEGVERSSIILKKVGVVIVIITSQMKRLIKRIRFWYWWHFKATEAQKNAWIA